MQKYTTNQTGFFYNIVESKYLEVHIEVQFHFFLSSMNKQTCNNVIWVETDVMGIMLLV